MQALILLVLSIGVFVCNGMSQPAPAADFVVEAGELLNDKVGTSNKENDAARNTIQLFVRAIKMDDFDALFKLVAHTAWRGVSMAVKSSKQSGDDKIIALVLFTIVNGDGKITGRTGNVVLAKNTGSPTGWIIAQFPKQTTPAKHRTMIPINRKIDRTIVAN
ncbi:unnamed protein product [Caenorhabditis brenneri]